MEQHWPTFGEDGQCGDGPKLAKPTARKTAQQLSYGGEFFEQRHLKRSNPRGLIWATERRALRFDATRSAAARRRARARTQGCGQYCRSAFRPRWRASSAPQGKAKARGERLLDLG